MKRQFVKPIIDTIKKIIKDSKEPASKKFYALLVIFNFYNFL